MTQRRFRLIRYLDVSGVSGTGEVAEGTQFSDASVAVRWISATPCTAIWDSIEALLAVHGHGGTTKIGWIDLEPMSERELIGATAGRCWS